MRKAGSGGGRSGEAVGGGRRGWPRPSAASPPRQGEACPPRARPALGAGGGGSCAAAAAAGLRRWGPAQSGDRRAAAVPALPALPALPSAAAGTDGVALRSRGWRMCWGRFTLVVPCGGRGLRGARSRRGRGQPRLLPPESSRGWESCRRDGLAWRKGSTVSPEERRPRPSSG